MVKAGRGLLEHKLTRRDFIKKAALTGAGMAVGGSLASGLVPSAQEPKIYLPLVLKRPPYYVAPDGDDSNPGTEAQPFQTINRGIGVLSPGDTLYVRGGTYTENLLSFPSGLSWDEPITIAAYPGDRVVLRAASGSWLVRFTECQHIVLRGFILDGVNAEFNVIKITHDGHHIRVEDCEVCNAPESGIRITRGSRGSDISGTFNEFINLIVHDNGTTDLDHGFYLATSHNTVQGCDIHSNAGKGVHIRGEGSGPGLRADDNLIRGNRIHDNARVGERGFGVGINSGTGNLIETNLIWGNNGGIKVAYNDPVDTRVYNNTVYANGGEGIWEGIWIEASSTGTVIRNNIIYQNEDKAIRDEGVGTIADHNLVDTDPKFIDAPGHDFHLRPDSPAIDAGITLSEIPDDFDGIPRPQGAGYDIGAYELDFAQNS